MKRTQPHTEDYPGAIADGLKTALGMVLGPLAAMILALLIVLIVIGDGLSSGFIVLGLVVFPVSLVLDATGLVILVLLIAALITFWRSERFKIDALFAICILTQVRVHALCTFRVWPRATVGILITCVIYASMRFGPTLWRRWRERRLAQADQPADDPRP